MEEESDDITNVRSKSQLVVEDADYQDNVNILNNEEVSSAAQDTMKSLNSFS